MFGIHVRTPRINLVKRSAFVPDALNLDVPRALRPLRVDLRPRVTGIAPAARGVTRAARSKRPTR